AGCGGGLQLLAVPFCALRAPPSWLPLWRPRTMQGASLADADPLVRCRNVHELTILRHRASRHRYAALLEHVGQLGVRKRLARVLVVDQAADHGLDRGAGRLAATVGVDAREIGR